MNSRPLLLAISIASLALASPLGLGLMSAQESQAELGLGLVPLPKRVEVTGAGWRLAAESRLVVDSEALLASAEEIAGFIERLTGTRLAVAQEEGASESPGLGDIAFATDGAMGPGAYVLASGSEGVRIRGRDLDGILHGAATLLQCMRPDGSLPGLLIEDAPADGLRMVWLDVARKYHSLDVLHELLELCFLLRITHVGLHLTDDQNFQFPSEAFPNLDDGNVSGRPAYPRAELVRLDARAAALGIELVPELDIPGHSTRLRAAYPEVFGDDGGSIDIRLDSCRAAVATLIDEMCAVFRSSTTFHVGGDESSAMGREEFPGFLRELRDQLAEKGRTTLVWEGFPKRLSEEVPEDLIVVAWSTRYQRPGDLLEGGFRIVNASWDPLYVVEHYPWVQWTYHTPERILDYRKERFAHVDKGAPGSTPIVVDDSSGVIGSMLCWWEGSGDHALPILRPRLAAFAEATWNQDAKPTADEHNLRRRAFRARVDDLLFPAAVLSPEALPFANDLRRQFDVAQLTVTASAPAGATLRYALDEAVGPESPLLDEPLVLEDSAILEVAAYRGGARIGYPTLTVFQRVQRRTESIALGRSVQSNRIAQPGHPPAMVVDGVVDEDSYWTAYVPPHRSAEDPSFVTIDLESPQVVSRIVVHTARFRSGYSEGYALDGSVDGSTWERLVETPEDPPPAVEGGLEHALTPRPLRFIRLTSKGNNQFPSGHFARIVEIEVF